MSARKPRAGASDRPRARALPAGRGVLDARPDLGGARSTPAFSLPDGAPSGLPTGLGARTSGGRTFTWGTRTFVMGILNVTPDSFSGDGLLARTPAAAPGGPAGAGGAARGGAHGEQQG